MIEEKIDMIKRAIHLFPIIEQNIFIDNIRKSYDPLFGLIDPHITIIFPFESNLSLKALMIHVREAIKNTRPFYLSLSNLETTQDHCLILKVKEGVESCVKLHQNLYTGILYAFLQQECIYTPHLTVGRFKNRSECQEALKFIGKFNHIFRSKIDKLTIEIILEDDYSLVESEIFFDSMS